MVVLKTFLGTFQLRTGCLYIGYGGSISSILWLIGSLALVVIYALNEHYLKGIGMEYEMTMNKLEMGVSIFIMIISAISFFFHVVLLIGVYAKRPILMNVYLGCMTAYLVMFFNLGIVVTVFVTPKGVFIVFLIALCIYNLMVIGSHRSEIEGAMSPLPYGVNNGANQI